MDIRSYFHEVEILLLHLRDEGQSLSSADLQVVEGWWDAAVPLPAVLGGLRKGAARLARRRRRVRGLKLESLAADVAKQARRASKLGMPPQERDPETVWDGTPWEADGPMAPGPDPSRPETTGEGGGQDASETAQARWLGDALLDAAERLDSSRPEVSSRLRDLVRDTRGLHAERIFVGLLETSRAFYLDRWSALPDAEGEALRRQIVETHGPALARMSPAAREETVTELARRRLMEADPVLDPDRVVDAPW